MIHQSYGRDSGRCGAFSTTVVQKTITTVAVCCSTEDLSLLVNYNRLHITTTAVVQQYSLLYFIADYLTLLPVLTPL